MLKIQDIYDLAAKHNLQVTNDYTRTSPPQLLGIMLWLKEKNPEVWKTLLTSYTEVPVEVRGSRQQTGSGATDGTFYPCYRELLPEVNAIRKEMGLSEVRN